MKDIKWFFFSTMLLTSALSVATANTTIRIQGRLTDNTGAPITGGTNLVELFLFSSISDGTLLAQALGDDGKPGDSITVVTNDAGLFSHDVEFSPLNVFDSAADLFLEVKVQASGDYRALSPRQKLSAVPFAIHAQSASTSDSTLGVGNNSVGSPQIIDESITSVDIASGTIQAVNLASAAVTTVAISDGGVTDAKIFSMSASKITGQVTSTQIATVDATQLTSMSGIVVAFGGTVPPPGWLLCDGSAVSRAIYSTLFGVVGVNFGSGDGSTTFNVPDLRGRFVRGVSGATTRDPDSANRISMNVGGNTGNIVGSIQGESVGPHTHSITDPGHTHSVEPDLSKGVVAVQNGHDTSQHISGGGNDGGSFAVTDTLSSKTGISINKSTGSETRPINAYLNYIIKI